jgi:hypothetical protein
MFGSHKRILTIVITVVSLLAMLAPAALAAPEWLHGIELTAPLGSDPAYLTAPDAKFDLEFNILTAGMQVCDVEVHFAVLDQNGSVVGSDERTYAYEDLQKAVNPEIYEDFTVGWMPDGWYNIELKAHEVGYKHQPPYNVECDKNVWTDTENGVKAFLLDRVAPKAMLVKPADNHWKGATFVTGQDFLLVGTAEDRWGVEGAWFELCPEGIWACLKWWGPDLSKPDDENWLPIGGVPADQTPGIPGQWQAEWDSTTVPDGFYFIRICAEDVAGNTNCADSRAELPLVSEDGTEHFNPWPDAHWVYVNNRVEIPLQVGWNLISSPLLPYDNDITDVLSHLIAHGTVEGVWTMVYEGAPLKQVWKSWTAGPAPDTLAKIVDGQGYWIKMKANDSLTIVGTWTTLGDGETPPAYPVYDGWNLIGYTHWGRPTIWPTDTVGDYLGAGLIDNLQALFYYDPWTNVWKKLYEPHNMVLGKGYWLSTVEAGVIRF